MPSPFPGMDPYVESCGLWDDFHFKFVGEIERDLASHVPAGYLVRAGERYFIDVCVPEEVVPGAQTYRAQSDMSVVRSDGERSETAASDVAVMDAPVLMEPAFEQHTREYFIDIREARSGRIVTTLELLSPANKRRDSLGRREYLRKREACMFGGRNFVEIDLLRGGARMPMASPWPPCEYYVMVSRGEAPTPAGVWPVGIRDALPEIPIPLDPGDADVRIDLGPHFTSVYDRSRYGVSIDYTAPLRPKLPDEDLAWVDSLLRQEGLR